MAGNDTHVATGCVVISALAFSVTISIIALVVAIVS